jgi:hypothetical protein
MHLAPLPYFYHAGKRGKRGKSIIAHVRTYLDTYTI